MVTTIGWTFEEEGSEGKGDGGAMDTRRRSGKGKRVEIIADPVRYKKFFIKEASQLLKGSEAQKSNFAYSTLRVAKGGLTPRSKEESCFGAERQQEAQHG